jgi:membrane protease YdiL (CAAX protease family)
MNNALENKTQATDKYWGIWSTLGFSFLIIIVFGLFQSLFLFGHIFLEEGEALTQALLSESSTASLESFLQKYSYDGDAISFAEIPAALLGIGLILLFISIRKQLTIKEYLGLYRPKLKPFLAFMGLMIIAMIMMESIASMLEIETPEFMTKVYNSTENLPLLWIAVGIAAPFFEEIFFRGFLLEGLRRSFIGTTGAILFSSASWALIHMQYGMFEIISIFLIGILLSIAKLKTNSLYVPIAMHMLMNMAANVSMALSS